jgi:hypothetical protein
MEDGWITSREATIRVAKATGQSADAALFSIVAYAQTGHIRARALAIKETIDRHGNTIREDVRENADVPLWFWQKCTAYDRCALNWRSGVFSGRGYVNGKSTTVDLTGVQFEAEGLKYLAPSPETESLESRASPAVDPPAGASAAQTGGRRRSELWPEWIAELVLYIHLNGIPEGEGSQGQEEIIRAVADRLMERGIAAPSRTSVQRVVRAVLARLRSAEN